MGKAVLTCAKAQKGTAAGGGLSAHIERQIWDPVQKKMIPFMPESVTHPEKMKFNKEYILPPGVSRSEAIEQRIKEAGITRKIKASQVKCLAFLCTSDKNTMDSIVADGRFDDYAKACIDFFRKEMGFKNVVSAVAHFDETTPHLHISVVPIVEGQAKERPDTKKQHEARNGKDKRSYNKQKVTARLCAKEVFTPARAEHWQTAFVEFLHERGFDFERGLHGSKAKHVNPADYNAKMAELKELNDKKNDLSSKVEILDDRYGSLRDKIKQCEKSLKGLKTMIDNLNNQRSQLTTSLNELKQELDEGRITLDSYTSQKANLEKQISDCDNKLNDKQKKLDTKTAELKNITDNIDSLNVAKVRFNIPSCKLPVPHISSRPPRLGSIDEWIEKENASIKRQHIDSINKYAKVVMNAAQESIIEERKDAIATLKNFNELIDRFNLERGMRITQKEDMLDLLDMLETPDTHRLVQAVVYALMGGSPISIPCAGGGSSSSHDGWDGRKKNEDDKSFLLRCWLHAGKVVKKACTPQKKTGRHR